MTLDDKWYREVLPNYNEYKMKDELTLGGVTIRNRTIQESFDFSIEEIVSKYSDFLKPMDDLSESEVPETSKQTDDLDEENVEAAYQVSEHRGHNSS